MRLPVTVAGALMPDAHVGYGVPIGAVVALDGAVAPYMVGVDIACRMMMTLYPPTRWPCSATRAATRSASLRSETRFGIGARFTGRPPPARRAGRRRVGGDAAARLLDKAYAQLGTSGTGNHFVDAGRLDVGAAGAPALGVPGRLLRAPDALGQPRRRRQDRGSLLQAGPQGDAAAARAPGAGVARHGHRARPGVLDEHGARRPLRLGVSPHDARRAGGALGIEPVATVENHHNFAWKETASSRRERQVIVHRKGATPAGGRTRRRARLAGRPVVHRARARRRGVAQQRQPRCRPLDEPHAGQARARPRPRRLPRRAGVELLGSGLDEAPQAYKNIDEVLALQRDLAEPVAAFYPSVVLMASDGKSEG